MPSRQSASGAYQSMPTKSICVGPGEIELRAPEPVRVLAGKAVSHRPVRPDEAPARGLEARPDLLRPDRKKPRGARDHHLAHRLLVRPDQRHAPRAGLHARAHPFRARPRLARPASAEEQPDAPLGGRRQLKGMRPAAPQVGIVVNLLIRLQGLQHLRVLARLQGVERSWLRGRRAASGSHYPRLPPWLYAER